MAEPLHLDIETYSECDLKAAGAYRYAEHPSTEILCFAYAFGEGEVKLWAPGEPVSAEVIEHVQSRGEVRAHNAQFERVLLDGPAGKKIGFPHLAIRQMVCTAAKMSAAGLPRSLGEAAEHLSAPLKDEGGRINMLQVTKPRRGKILRYTAENSPEKFENLYRYCMQDVVAERGIDKLVPELTNEEKEIYWLDQVINDRGVPVDLEVVATVRRMVEDYKEVLAAEMLGLTGLKPTQREKVAEWLRASGLSLPDLQADTVRRILLGVTLTREQRRVLLIYSTYNAKASAKFDAIWDAVCADGRLHGMFLYHGANTGRWSSLIVQLQNLARPLVDNPEEAVEIILQGDLDWLRANYPKHDPLKVIASCVRPALAAPEGKKLMFPDYAGIEARYCMWLFDEEWKLEVFRRQDAGTGPDSYKSTYGQMFGVDPKSVSKFQRQIGKVTDLAMQYEGGVGAFVTMAQTYGLDLQELVKAALPILPDDALDSAEWMWGKFGARSGLDHDTYIALDGTKYLWRKAHPNVRKGWKDMRDAAIAAVSNPGKTYAIPNKRARFRVVEFRGHSWLCLQLPSGRVLRYFSPRYIEPTETRSETGFSGEDFVVERTGGELRFWGVDTETRIYSETATYGGKLTENATQGGCACILRRALVDLNVHGFNPIGSVHDEPICEISDMEEGFEEEVRQLLCAPLKWAPEMPLAIEMNVNRRYRK